MRQEDFRFTLAKTDSNSINQYAELFKLCFPSATHLNEENLKWLYHDNPAGKMIGFNAYSGNTLAAHYGCIPTDIVLHGKRNKALLSLNTATHPQYQGNGLFSTLANQTYKHAIQNNFSSVIGVANQSSTHGFVKRLGFQLVSQLDVKIGFSDIKINWEACIKQADFYKFWDSETLNWRLQTPKGNMHHSINTHGDIFGSATTGLPCLHATNPIYLAENNQALASSRRPFALKLFLGLFPKDSVSFSGYFDLPERLKPSPLNLIYKPLNTQIQTLDPNRVIFGFQDFDAY